MQFKTQEEFFKNVGDQWLHPTQYGEVFFACTVEEMYQHFKARLMKELHAERPGGNLVEREEDAGYVQVEGAAGCLQPQAPARTPGSAAGGD